MVYRPITEPRLCNYTYVDERTLPKGQKLQQCTRCKEVYYTNAKSQRMIWAGAHQQTCLSLELDRAQNTTINLQANMPNIQYCLHSLRWLLNDPFENIKGRAFLYCLQELRRILTSPPVFPRNFSEGQIHDFIVEDLVKPFKYCVEQHGESFLNLIWTIPGFSSFMLNEDIFIAPIMQIRKLHGIEPIQPGDRDEIKTSPGYRLVEPYWTGMVSLLETTIYDDGPNIQGPKFRETALTSAIVRVVMQCWSSSNYVRQSTRHITGVPQFYLSVFNTSWQLSELKFWMQPEELIPGITAKGLLRTLMEDDCFLTGLTQQYLEAFLRSIYGLGVDYEADPNRPFSHFTAKDRIQLLDLSHDWKAPKRKIRQKCPDFFLDVRTAIVHMITGTTTRILLDMHQEAMTMSPPPDARTVAMVKKIHSDMLKTVAPQVAAYTKVIEPKYKKRMQRLNEEIHPFPDDLTSVIAEYSFGDKYYWTTSKDKGLKFLTNADQNAFSDQYMNLLHSRDDQHHNPRERTNQHTSKLRLLSQIIQTLVRNVLDPLLGGQEAWGELFVRTGRAERVVEYMVTFANRWCLEHQIPSDELLMLLRIEDYNLYLQQNVTHHPLIFALRQELFRYLEEHEFEDGMLPWDEET